jgi:hypothetical protein
MSYPQLLTISVNEKFSLEAEILLNSPGKIDHAFSQLVQGETFILFAWLLVNMGRFL